MRIGPAANVARLNVAENITALWTFANALGLLTDDINERTAAEGVTIDGVRLRNGALGDLDYVDLFDDVIATGIVGDTVERFRLEVNGGMLWGPGDGAPDTVLGREAPDELGTPDDFNVGGVLDLAGDIELSVRSALLGAGDNNDLDIGAVTTQRFTANAAGSDVTGMADGRSGRMVIIFNVGTAGIVMEHENANSVAANRLINITGANIAVVAGESVSYLYDSTTGRWRQMGPVT